MAHLPKFLSRLLDGLTGKTRREERERQQALYLSPLLLQSNGETIARMTDMYIPDQFWKHYKVEIITRDAELRRRMLEDETFWDSEFLALVREVDGLKFAPDSFLFCLNQAHQLKETGELSIRGI